MYEGYTQIHLTCTARYSTQNSLTTTEFYDCLETYIIHNIGNDPVAGFYFQNKNPPTPITHNLTLRCNVTVAVTQKKCDLNALAWSSKYCSSYYNRII